MNEPNERPEKLFRRNYWGTEALSEYVRSRERRELFIGRNRRDMTETSKEQTGRLPLHETGVGNF